MKYLLAKLGSNLKDLNLSQNTMTSSILAELSVSFAILNLTQTLIDNFYFNRQVVQTWKQLTYQAPK
jgi:hypothetical protein